MRKIYAISKILTKVRQIRTKICFEPVKLSQVKIAIVISELNHCFTGVESNNLKID